MKKTLIAFILFLTLLTGCNTSANLPVYYGQFCNGKRTSFKDVKGLKKCPDKVVWKYTSPVISDEIYFLTLDAPTVAGDVVYIKKDAALNLDTGKVIWENHYKDYSYSVNEGSYPYSGILYGNKIFIVGGYPNEYLEAYDKDTGKLAWKSECIGSVQTNTTSGCPLIINGKVYLAASGVKSYKKDKDEQAAIWVWDANSGKVVDKIFLESAAEPFVGKYRTLFPLTTMLASDRTDIYGITKFTNDGTHRDYIFCYDTTRNKCTWFEPIEGFKEGYREMIAVDKDVVAVSLVGDQWSGKEPQFFIKVYDKTSHKPLWESITKSDRNSGPVFNISYITLHGGKLYAMTMDKKLVCFDARTGEKMWSFKDKDWQSKWWDQINRYGNIFRENDICVTDSVAYFNVDKAIYALDAETGDLLWRTIAHKGYSFVNIMPVNNGLIVTYQDNLYDSPQEPAVTELWK